MIKNNLLLTESEKNRILGLHKDAIIRVLSEQEVKQGFKGDPYQYKKEAGKYYFANKSEGVTPKWREQTNPKGVEAICTRIFGEPAGCSTSQTNFDGGSSGAPVSGGIDSGVSASPQTIVDGVAASTFGANCTKITVTGSFPAEVTTNPNNITNFINKVKDELQSNPAISKDYAAGKVYIAGVKLIGGASNSYEGTIKPEMDNNYNIQSYPDNASYNATNGVKNKALATQRANGLYAELQTQLPTINLKFGPNATPEIAAYTVDTGGRPDSKRVTSKYKNPGQVVIVQMDICATAGGSSSKDSDKIGGGIPNTIDDFIKLGRDGFVLTGSYFCNGKNSRNEFARNTNVVNTCTQTQKTADSGKPSSESHLSTFEIKYKLNVNGNSFTQPVVRWKIYWDTEDKIKKIEQQQVNKNVDPEGIFPSKTISADDEFFRLALRGGNPDNPENNYNKFINPYL